MKNIIIYYSETGNTEELANLICSTLEDANIYSVDKIDKKEILNYKNIILGCPALGAEELDDSMKELSDYINLNIKDQNIFLFGSYGWGDGEWMRNWESEMKNFNASLMCNEGIANLEYDKFDEYIDKIRQY